MNLSIINLDFNFVRYVCLLIYKFNFLINFLRVVLETYTFLKGKQVNKWCFLKKFYFSNRTKKVDGGSII